ncbi:carbohydrate ABC transporter permease [Demequina sp. NBRC 110056]|uniref:carbohydrate ABC transporter permease n=1 Tax=Demequina sp. NBRC 110056 TaxID=1570345 RepID=UPI001F1912B6|nr:sugar ABC transporter permease [Demequina sp. NBRC 110056]
MTALEASGTGKAPAVDAKASAAGDHPVTPATSNPRRDARRKRLEIAIFVGPALLIFFTFVVFPMVMAARYSLYKWDSRQPFELAEFIGLDNYTRALIGGTDPETQEIFWKAYAEPFWNAVGNNGQIIVLSMLIQLPVAMIVALVLNRKFAGRSSVRLIIFAPYVLAEVTAGLMWMMLLDPRGPVTQMIQGLGLPTPSQGWLEDPTWGFWTFFFIVSWKYIGLAIILFLAGLAGVPQELQEAASIDGASWWQVQWRINIPLIGPTVRVWAFLSIIGSIQLFDMAWVLNKGGSTGQYSTIATLMVDIGTQRNDGGYASALAIIMFIFSMSAALAYMALIMRRDTANGRTRKAKKGVKA